MIGVDIGGTFTDVAVVDLEAQTTHLSKTPTRPDDMAGGVIEGLELVSEKMGIRTQTLLADTTKFAHGTTQSTNAIITRTGATVGLIATRGFGDQILIMRARGRVEGLSLAERRHFRATDKPASVVPSTHIQEVSERVDWKGSVIVPMDNEDALAAIRRLREIGVESLAVSLLWSFKNPIHERRIGELVARELPGMPVSLSSELVPVIGEYERTATTVLNAYVKPAMDRYLEELQRRLRELDMRSELLILEASGGASAPETLVPIHTVESGPAAGVVASQLLSEALGYPNVIATDVGGTTFKVSLIVEGAWSLAQGTVIDQYSVLIPMIDVASIGAGGGSVAWLDGERLRVGPASAGADPGPACYGRGGEQPTVTDADVVLGYIDPDYFLGGRMRLDVGLAKSAIQRVLADPLFGGDVVAAAAASRRVVDAQMADLVRKASIERGYDPSEFVLMAYGGAGPTHCAAYGSDLGIPLIVVPMAASVHSAFGAAASDLRHSLRVSDPQIMPADAARLEATFADLEQRVRSLLWSEGVAEQRMEIRRWVEMRYRRQVHAVRVPVETIFTGTVEVEALAQAFENRYEALYGRGAAYRDAGTEILTLGVDAVGRIARPSLTRHAVTGRDSGKARKGERPVYWSEHGGFAPTAVYDGRRLGPGNELVGPAIIELPDTTVAVPPGMRAEVDEYLNLVLRR